MGDTTPKIYRVKGKFLCRDHMQPFAIETMSMKPEDAREKVYSEFGSKHRVKRNRIVIENIEEIPPEEAKDPVVRYMAGE